MKLVFCHRRKDRTFKIRNKYFPVCSRCTGIYIGVLIFFLLNIIYHLEYNLELFLISLTLMLPTAIDGTTQLFGWRESRNSIRFITGLVAGIGYGLFLIVFYYFLKI